MMRRFYFDGQVAREAAIQVARAALEDEDLTLGPDDGRPSSKIYSVRDDEQTVLYVPEERIQARGQSLNQPGAEWYKGPQMSPRPR